MVRLSDEDDGEADDEPVAGDDEAITFKDIALERTAGCIVAEATTVAVAETDCARTTPDAFVPQP